MSREKWSGDRASALGWPPRAHGRCVTAMSGRLLACAAATALAIGARSPAAAQDTTAAEADHGPDVVRVLITQDFADKLDSIPAEITWDDIRKGVAVQYDASTATVKTAKRAKFVLYAAMASGGKIQKESTSDGFDVFPGASLSQPDKFLPEESMLPAGVTPKGTFVVGTVTVPESGLLSEDMKGILEDLSGSSPLLYLLAAPADEAARAKLKAAPLILTMQQGS
jgi:hypothetical protein